MFHLLHVHCTMYLCVYMYLYTTGTQKATRCILHTHTCTHTHPPTHTLCIHTHTLCTHTHTHTQPPLSLHYKVNIKQGFPVSFLTPSTELSIRTQRHRTTPNNTHGTTRDIDNEYIQTYPPPTMHEGKGSLS